MGRPTADEYFMGLAYAATSRSTCGRAKVGAVIVLDGFVAATGYNGGLPGAPECDQKDCQLTRQTVNGPTVTCNTVHAEANAIFQALSRGQKLRGATLYVTYFPCLACMQQLCLHRFSRVVYSEKNTWYNMVAPWYSGSIQIDQLVLP